ncbi:IclR family transcriptional regulator [Tersicoccus solisilvae]|uniref:IclR family transcriptional regulator n=1 Tax=Tersicoccus solisilvae TaxID=1882339 RepID=A0ABQ1NWI8_9MICC|nr:IclR family transcriptional regulator [Tersicoccus solisilvae]GGC86264.1 IclR family transcriptional regulator [Tersicoccus solisilvae]
MANSPSGDSMIDRIIRILGAFTSERPAMTVGALATRAGIPLATTHRIVRELVDQRMLERDGAGRVRLGIRLWELASRGSSVTTLRQVAMPFLEDVQSVVRQHTQLTILQDGGDVLFVERLSWHGSIANAARVAGRLPAPISSSGVALLAFGDRARTEHYLRYDYDPGAPWARMSVAELRRLLAHVRREGYALLDSHVVDTTSGVAVPVLGPDGLAVAALGVVVPAGQERVGTTVPVLQTAARGIARRAADLGLSFNENDRDAGRGAG